jgi:hypothetical protein
MDLPPAKIEVLEALLLHVEPARGVQIAKELDKKFPAVQMHLIGLVKMGYAMSPQKGHYIVSESGKKALGLGEITQEKALKLLARVPEDRAFHFYEGIGKPLQLYAHDLLDFCDKVSKVQAESVEFHLDRGDFEAWFESLGDDELALKTSLLKRRKLTLDELRSKLREIAEDRCIVLSKKVGQTGSNS